MTDFPYICPPTDGLQLAMATARGRRLRKAGFSSGATAFALAVVALLTGSSGQQTLLQPTPEIPAVTSVDKVPAGRTTPPVANRLQPGSLTAFGGNGNPGTTLAAGPGPLSAVLGRAPGNDPVASDGRPAAPYRSAVMKRDDGRGLYLPTDFQCTVNNDGTARTSPLCPGAYVRQPGSSGTEAYALETSVCSSDTKPTVLHYPTTREVDLVIYRGTKAVWHWSRTQAAPRTTPHTLSLDTGYCYGWTTDWNAVDDSGAKLPAASDYRMVATFMADEVSDFSTYEVAFSVS